jgi:hypothetical protein
MNHLAYSLGTILLCLTAVVAAPAPFPKPVSEKEQLERQLREFRVQVADVKQVGPRSWIVACPAWDVGCLVGVKEVPRRIFRVDAPDRSSAIKAFLTWRREQEEQRLRKLRVLGVIR